MNKTKRVLSLVMALLMAFNVFAIAVSAEDTADYSALNAYINTCVPSDNDAGIYSADSMAAFEQVLNSIDYNLTSDAQGTVDGYLTAVKAAAANLVADETKATAAFTITASRTKLLPGMTFDVNVVLNTNYNVFAASAAVLYDKNVFEIVAASGSAATSYFDASTGSLANYTKVGNYKYVESMYSRNNNPDYWKTQTGSVGIAYLGFAGDSSKGNPVKASGTVATFKLKVKDNVAIGSTGYIMMSSDWNKTASCAGGLNFVSRTVGQNFGGGTAGAVSVGQTIDLSNANVTVAIDHTWSDWTVTKEPTCVEPGEETRTDLDNSQYTETREITALGHDWSEWVVTTAATYDSKGIETRTCLRAGCGETETREIPILEHNWGEWEVVTPATCTAVGVETRTCLDCGETETREIPMIAHTWSTDYKIIKSPTKNTIGYKAIYCTVCGAIKEDSIAEIGKLDILGALSLTRCTGTYIATDEGATVTINSNPNASPNIAVGPAANHTLTMDRGTGPILGLVSGGRYTFNPVNAAKVGDRFETTMTVDGYPYKIVWIYNRIPFTIDQLIVNGANYENGVTLDPTTKTITINSKIGGTSVDIYNVSNTLIAFTFEIPEDGNVDLYTTYRYKVTKPENADQVTTTLTVKSINPTEVYTVIVNFIPAPFNPSAYIAPVAGGVELKTINGVESILISRDPTRKYVGIKTAGLQGATLAITEVSGMQLIQSSAGYMYYKINLPTDEADVATSITITFATGKVVTYPLIFRFKAAEFTPSVLDAVNLDIAKSTYNNVANTMTLVSTTDSYVRIYKKTISGLTLSINAADYPFMTEYTNFYQIDKNKLKFADCGIARFNVYIADEDRTIATSVAFPGSGTLSTEFFTSSNATFTVSGNVITIKIGADKSNALLYRNLTNASAERLSMTYDTGTTYIADLTAANDSYKIYKAAAGMDITITISGVTYTLVVTS